MLSRAERLNTKAFATAFANGKTARHPLLSVRIWRRCDEKTDQIGLISGNGISNNDKNNGVRAAFVVPKKQAKAVKRNGLRRRMRECYRQHPALSQQQAALQGCDLIFVATPLAHSASWDELNEALAQLLRRAARLASETTGQMKHSFPKETNDSKTARFQGP